MAELNERERRELAHAHRGEVEAGSGSVLEGRKLGQVVSIRFEPETLSLLREIAERRRMTVSDLLREGAGMVIAKDRQAVQITEFTLNVSVLPVQPQSWQTTGYPTSNAIGLPDVQRFSA